jgi:hypothetical protein
MNSEENKQEFPRIRKYDPVWELTDQGALRDKLLKDKAGSQGKGKELHLCGGEKQCVEYNRYHKEHTLTNTVGIGTATFFKRSMGSQYLGIKKYGTFVMSRGTGAPIMDVDFCPIIKHSMHQPNKKKINREDKLREWFRFAPLIGERARDIKGACPSDNKLRLWSEEGKPVLCYRKYWRSITLDCDVCKL